jgi:hypothetical protein
MIEQVRPGKGSAPAAGAVLAAVDNEGDHRLEPANGKDEGKAVKDAAWAAVRGVAEDENYKYRKENRNAQV